MMTTTWGRGAGIGFACSVCVCCTLVIPQRQTHASANHTARTNDHTDRQATEPPSLASRTSSHRRRPSEAPSTGPTIQQRRRRQPLGKDGERQATLTSSSRSSGSSSNRRSNAISGHRPASSAIEE